jgi:hypothetical protein
MTEPFVDHTIMTDIAGFTMDSWSFWAGAAVRRWWTADWFQPIARIGRTGNAEWPLAAIDGARAVDVSDYKTQGTPDEIAKAEAARQERGYCAPITDTSMAQAPEDRTQLRRTYVSQFVAPASGQLYLYVNDAIAAAPFLPTLECFYKNNSGSAKVTVEQVPVPKPASGVAPVLAPPARK